LVEEKDRYLSIFDTSEAAILLISRETHQIIESNPRFASLIGYPEAELQGAPVSRFWQGEEPFESFLDRILPDRPVVDYESRLRARDGTIRHVLISGRLRDQDVVVLTLIDISERKKAQIALERSEERYRNVVEGQTEFISRFRPDGTHVFANEAYLRYFGLNRAEVIGKKFAPALLPEDRERMRVHISSLTRENPAATIEHRIIMPDGSVRWQQWSDRAIFDEAGRLVEYQSVGRDITANKQAEEALAKSEEKLRTVVENVPDLILVHRDGIPLYANPAATRVMEYTPDELLNTHLTAHIVPEYLSRVAAAMQKRMAGEPVEPYEIDVITKSGGHRTVLVSGSRIDYVGGPASLIVLTDVTERIRYENSLRTSLREKEVLLKEVHHRVKNNMQVISSLLSLQANSIRDPTDLVSLQECERRVRAMALVHEKLYQSKDLSGVSARDYLGSLVNDLVSSYSLAAEIRIQLEIEEIPLDLDMASPCGLIVNELVTNALKYAFKGWNRGVLTVRMARVPGHRYTLTVQDDGVGFPPGLDLRTAETLGLKLVWVLSHQLDGDVRVERGSGTRFVITFLEKVR
jgi:PAS domain S-box-containing protein